MHLELKNILNDQNLKQIKTLDKNDHRQTYTLLVQSKDQEELVCKICLSQNPLFEVEKKFYLTNDNALYPKLISYGENFFTIEYYNYPTVRSFIKEYLSQIENDKIDPNFYKNLEFIFKKFSNYKITYDNNTKHPSAKHPIKKYRGILLLSSAKSQKSKNNYYISKIFNYLCALINYRKEKKLSRNNFPIQMAHNDLHLNNLLFSAEKKDLKIIDFENVNLGFPVYDLLYFTANLCILFYPNKNHIALVKKLFFELKMADNNHASEVLEYFFSLALCNPKLNTKEKLGGILKNMLFMVINKKITPSKSPY